MTEARLRAGPRVAERAARAAGVPAHARRAGAVQRARARAPCCCRRAASALRPPDAPVSAERLTALGRAALRSIGALDGGDDLPGSEPYMLLERKVLPAWPVRLLAIALHAARAARRGRRVRARAPPPRARRHVAGAGSALSVLPFVLAALLAIGLFRTGLIEAAPDAPVAGLASAPNAAALASVAVAGAARVVRAAAAAAAAARRRRGTSAAGAPRPRSCSCCASATLVVWIAQPVREPAADPGAAPVAARDGARDAPAPAGRAGCCAALGLLPPLLVAYAYARQFGLDPLELAWMVALLVAGGGALAAGGARLERRARLHRGRARRRPARERRRAGAAAPITVRGPKTYAGPGSLGGTESALRR